jgi:hypothetical protein
MMKLLLSLVLLVSTTLAMEFGSSKGVPVSAMLHEHSSCIDLLKQEAVKNGANLQEEPFSNDVFYLRFCLSHDYSTTKDRLQAFRDNLSWRRQEGKAICDSAREAVSQAFVNDKWDYNQVHKRVPNAVIRKYLTPAQVQTVVSAKGDLVFCMKHSLVQDKELMRALENPNEVVDFMIYSKEVNAIVANRHSLKSDRLAFVLTANDLNGASLARGDKQFRAALNDSARLAARLYPSLTGPTLMLNLPSWLTSIARAFAPSEVSHTLRFAQGPLKNIDTLTDIASDGPERTQFFTSLNELVYAAP